jgi:type IV secretory pathway TrbD component
VSSPVRVAIFPALTQPQTIRGCERRIFFTFVLTGGFLAFPCGLFSGRIDFVLLGALVFLGGIRLGAEWTKKDPQVRDVHARAFFYSPRYVASGRFDQSLPAKEKA